jgi:4-hydroxybenzoate polyprenyltransferase
VTWLAFNPATFYILLTALVLGGLYSAYLRDRVGYLALPPIVGLIYLGGWAAFAPDTLFNSWLPWYLYLLGVVWQTAHIMIYYPLHVIDADAPPALFFRPSPRAAVRIGIIFTCLTLVLSGLLPLVAPTLGVLYVVPVIAAGIYALIVGFRLYKDTTNRKKGMVAFNSLSAFRLIISAAILLTVFLA